jgi:hypothetical protein
MVYWSILEVFVIDYTKVYQLCVVHMNASCNEYAGLSTGARLGYNFTAKNKGSNQIYFYNCCSHRCFL